MCQVRRFLVGVLVCGCVLVLVLVRVERWGRCCVVVVLFLRRRGEEVVVVLEEEGILMLWALVVGSAVGRGAMTAADDARPRRWF